MEAHWRAEFELADYKRALLKGAGVLEGSGQSASLVSQLRTCCDDSKQVKDTPAPEVMALPPLNIGKCQGGARGIGACDSCCTDPVFEAEVSARECLMGAEGEQKQDGWEAEAAVACRSHALLTAEDAMGQC